MASSTPPQYSISPKPHQNPSHNPQNQVQKQPGNHNQSSTSQRLSSSVSSSSLSSSSSASATSICSASTLSGTAGVNPTVTGGLGGGSASPSFSSTATRIWQPRNVIFRPPRAELGPEFRGSRSTRVISKRNFNRPRSSSGGTHNRPSSPAAVDCLNQLILLGFNYGEALADMLLSYELLLSGSDDYGFLIKELGERGDCQKVIRCFDFAMSRMRDRTEKGKLLTAVISALGKMGRADLARMAFDVGLSERYAHTVYAYSALISAYGRSGCSSEAIRVFESMKAVGLRPNNVTYNTLIDACGRVGESLHRMTEVFREMLRNGVRPDKITFNSLLAGCTRAGHWDEARVMFDEMIHLGIGRDVYTFNTFIDAACKCGNMELAVQIMYEMPTSNVCPNVVTYSTLMDGYLKLERYDEAFKLYEELKSLRIPSDRVFFNTLLSIYVKMGRYEDVVRVSEEMNQLGIDRDVVTYNALLAGYGKQGRFDVVGYLIQCMREDRIDANVLTYSTLIDVYSKAGMYQNAMQVYMEFRETGLKSDVVLYSSLIDTLCKNGLVESAVWFLNEMIRVGVKPNVVTYNSIIDAFGKSTIVSEDDGIGIEMGNDDGSNQVVRVFGQLAEGRGLPVMEESRRNPRELFCILGLFRRMHYLGIKPNVVTFSAILNACSRCNSFEEASMLLEQLQSFDKHVYGVAHGLLMGSKEVWVQAHSIFDELCSMDSSTAAGFYNALTDVLWHFGQRKGAQLVVLEARRRKVWDNISTNACLDLHLMSSGAAQAMVYTWLLNLRSVVFEVHGLPNCLSILTGWGKHSKVAGASTVQRAVGILLASMGAPFQVERFNLGRFMSHGAVVASWLKDYTTPNTFVLRDDRTRRDTRFSLSSNMEALRL